MLRVSPSGSRRGFAGALSRAIQTATHNASPRRRDKRLETPQGRSEHVLSRASSLPPLLDFVGASLLATNEFRTCSEFPQADRGGVLQEPFQGRSRPRRTTHRPEEGTSAWRRPKEGLNTYCREQARSHHCLILWERACSRRMSSVLAQSFPKRIAAGFCRSPFKGDPDRDAQRIAPKKGQAPGDAPRKV